MRSAVYSSDSLNHPEFEKNFTVYTLRLYLTVTMVEPSPLMVCCVMGWAVKPG